MSRPLAKMLAAVVVLDLCLAAPFAGLMDQAQAFGHGGGHFGGGHFGGDHFGGGHFGGMHFGGMHFGGRHFGGRHFGIHRFGMRRGFSHHGAGAHFAGAHGHLAGLHGHLAGARDHFAAAGGAAAHRAGATRNAFGTRRGWHDWNRGYRAYGWNGGGYGWTTWSGPVFWPYFYGDALSFVLWPYAFYDPFFDYGPDYIFAGIFWPGSFLNETSGVGENASSLYGYAGRAGALHEGEARNATSETATGSGGDLCIALAPGISNLPLGKIEKAIQPSKAQSALLNDIKAASAKAEAILRSSCPSQVPLTPVRRLEAIGHRIDATLQAVQLVQPPLTKLYESLGDEQKLHFDAVILGKGRAARAKSAPSASEMAALCKQQAEDFTNLPVQSIAQTIKPVGNAAIQFDALKSASAKAAQAVEASCPTTVPQTLGDRFGVIEKRLTAMSDAVKTVEPALESFYASLNDDQKAQFNLLSPPPRKAADSASGRS